MYNLVGDGANVLSNYTENEWQLNTQTAKKIIYASHF